jgi:hypothetical protein
VGAEAEIGDKQWETHEVLGYWIKSLELMPTTLSAQIPTHPLGSPLELALWPAT